MIVKTDYSTDRKHPDYGCSVQDSAKNIFRREREKVTGRWENLRN